MKEFLRKISVFFSLKSDRYLKIFFLEIVLLILIYELLFKSYNKVLKTFCLILFILLVICLLATIYHLIQILSMCDEVYNSFAEANGIDWQKCTKSRREFTNDIKNTLENLVNIIEHESEKYNAELLVKKAELATLQSQINPHFFYNTMESIRSIALANSIPDIAEIAEAISIQFRYIINVNNEFASLDDELDNLDNYLVIQKMRFKNRFTIIKKIECEDIVLNFEIPRFSIQPVVENSILHGFKHISQGGIIRIKAYLTNTNFIIEISDNGYGMKEDILQKLRSSLNDENMEEYSSIGRGNGVALSNLNSRIKLYYGKEYGISIFSEYGYGTKILLNFPRFSI